MLYNYVSKLRGRVLKELKMVDKKTIILNSIIREYIKNLEPISSRYLQSKIDIQISSATIRNYLKKMVDEGKLEQPHISSGRIPSFETLKSYWEEKIKLNKKIEIKNRDRIKESSEKYSIFCEYRFYEPNILKYIINFKDKYLILEFNKNEFILEYSERIEKFFHEFIGLEAKELVKICKQIGLVNLSKKINIILEDSHNIEGVNELLNIAFENREWGNRYLKCFLDGTVLDELQSGLYFEDIVPNGFLAYKESVKIKEKDAKLLFVGALNRDYENFIKNLTRG